MTAPARTSRRALLVVADGPGTLHAALAEAWADGARAAGAEVRTLHVGALDFDPHLSLGYASTQSLEPDLQRARELIEWSEHQVWAFPIWWGALPAKLKGLIDRAFLPGWAFRYRAGSALPEQLLRGRTAELIATMDSPGWWYRLWHRAAAHAQLSRATLGLCGVRTVGSRTFPTVRTSTPAQRERWLAAMRARGERWGRG